MVANNSRAKFNQFPLLWLSICFSAGILISNTASIDARASIATAAISTILALIFLKHRFAFIFVSLAFIAAGTFCFQIEKQRNAETRLRTLYDTGAIASADPVEIEGVLSGNPEQAAGGEFLNLRLNEIVHRGSRRPVKGNVKLFLAIADAQAENEFQISNLKYGSRVRIASNLEREDKFLNPGVMPHKTILDQQDLDAVGTIKSTLLIEKTGDESNFMPLEWIFRQRQNLIREFRDRFSQSAAGILIASLLGDKYFLDKNTADLFREGGTFHVLVISGLHITFIGALLLLFTRLFTRNRIWQFVFTCSVLWAYTLAVGADVPVVRASLMFTILLFSKVIYRGGTLLNSLGFCALFLLVWRPADLFTASFQLTFGSVAAIVAFGVPLIEILRKIGSWTPTVEEPFPPRIPEWLKSACEMLYWRESVWSIESKRQVWSAKLFKVPYMKALAARNLSGVAAYLFEGIIISFVIQIWLLPFMVVYFHRISIMSVLLNLWVGFFIALETFSALIAVFLGQISALAAWPFVRLTETFNWLLLSVPKLFVSFDWASFRLPAYTGEMRFVYVAYFVPLLVLTLLLYQWRPFDVIQKRSRKQWNSFLLYSGVGTLLLLACVIIFHPYSAPTPDRRLHVDFLDVGQGDSALVTFPNGETLLIDGGGRGNFPQSKSAPAEEEDEEQIELDTARIGEAVVSEFLWYKGYSKIDYILATHADADHIQGLTDVARNFRVNGALFGRTPVRDPDFAELYSILERKSVPVRRLARGESFAIGDATVEGLYPNFDPDPDAVSDNNHSLVLRVIFGTRKLLFTGDIESSAENDLLNTPELLRSDLIKVPHHGSRTSSTQSFIDAIGAEYAIISVGRRSRFGHPHREIVERWKNAEAIVKTTGEKGTISVSTDGLDLLVTQFLH